MIKIKYAVAILFTAVSLSSHAAAIDPYSISSATGCNANNINDCVVNWSSQFYTSDFAAVQIDRSTGSSWLIRYNLYAPSAQTLATYDDFTGTYTTSVTPYTGNIWLEAPTYLAPTFLSATNNFNVFTDQIDQNSGIEYTTTYLPTFNFAMTSTDVLNGSASYNLLAEPIYTATGNLTVFNTELSCVECSVDLTLNLNDLDYSTGQLLIWSLFDGNRENPLLIFDDSLSGYPTDFSSERDFYVSPVPVPAAVWLFGSGLIGLSAFAKRKKQ